MDILIDRENNGKCLREFLLLDLRISRAMLKHLKFLDDGILIDGAHVTVRHILKAGETLSIKIEDSEPSENIVPSDISVNVAFEDTDLAVLDKPPYMPTHPSHGHFDDTLANALCCRYKDKNAPFVFRPINRLDRNTSGLVLVARTRMAAASLSLSMKKGGIKKEYVAVLSGTLPCVEGEIDTYIKRESESIITRTVCTEGEGGDRAITKYKVIFSDGEHTVVSALPVTGRTHQLRLHFAHLGAAIVGDDMYGKESEYIGRHALHAIRLSFMHPTTAENIELCSPIPTDIEELICRLFSPSDKDVIFEALEIYKENKSENER